MGGFQATNRCSEATFFSKVEDEIISLYVLCSSDTSIELIQLKVETVLMQLYKSSESGWKKVIYIERTVVMEKGTACQSFMEQNTVSCVSNHLSTVEEDKILVYRLHTEPLRLTVIQKIPFVVFTQNRWLKEYAIESFQYVKAGTPRLLSFTAKLANQSRLLIDFVLNIQYFIDPTTTIITMPIILDITGTDMGPSDELRFCSTAVGRFYFDRVQNNIRILGVDTRTMYNSYAEAAVSNSAIAAQISLADGKLHKTVCLPNQGKWLLMFSQTTHYENLSHSFRTVLIDAKNWRNAHKRTLVDIKYYVPVSPDEDNKNTRKPLWIAYYDKENSSLVWHACSTELVETKVLGGAPENLKYTMPLGRKHSQTVSIVTPGVFDCELRGHFPNNVTGRGPAVGLKVDVWSQN